MIRFATPPQLTGCPSGSHGAAMQNSGWIDQSVLADPMADPMANPMLIQVSGGLLLQSGRYRCRHTVPQQD